MVTRNPEQQRFDQNNQKLSVGNYNDYGRSRRWTGPAGAENDSVNASTARFANTDKLSSDWRVKISVPYLSTFRSSEILRPLAATDYQVVFPLVPQISLVTSAAYGEMAPIHNNYPFPVYQHSRTEDINVAGEFPVQTPQDAAYWLAVCHFGRSITKMAYGETSNKGSPPPLCKLNGYGDYVLNNVPVVCTSFTIELPNNVDYIETNVAPLPGDFAGKTQYVPTSSILNFTLKPTYSRSKVEQFSFDKFVAGQLSDEGYI
jgi:hypothetical protein